MLSRVEQRFDRLQAAADEGQESLRQQQPRPGPDQVLGQLRKPPVNRRPFAVQEEDRVVMLLDQPGGPGHLPGGHRVPDRVIGQPALGVPGGRVTVQSGNPAGLFGLQAGAEEVGEQVVVAPPAAHLIQRHHEQPGPFDLLQQRLAAGPAGDRVAQLPRQPLQHRRLKQERAHLLTLVLEHLLGQVVQDVAVAAGERGDEPADVVLPAQRQGRQLQPGRPALGPRGQRRGGRVRQRRTGPRCAGRRRDLGQQRRRLPGREAQFRSAQLGQLPASPQPRQRQRRVAAAGQRQVQPGRPVLKQEPERGVHQLRADQVVVIQDQQQRLIRVRPGGDLVDQGRHQRFERRWRRRPEQRAHPLADPRPHPVQRGHRMPPEPGRGVVTGIQREPGHRLPAAPDPLGQQDSLAVPGRRADQDKSSSPALLQPLRQPRARHQIRPHPRHVQLGGQQDIALRRGSLRCGRLSHR